ncbi:nickel/cobalt transporter [Lonsdalea quercina]|uniref:nickel/cobalt transporter n=1 Tax=Lonsdalea quercina TaxID=71657 RepID=UPI003976385A
MPINLSSHSDGHTRRAVWPLLILLLALGWGLYEVWAWWPDMLRQSVIWQKSLHQQMSQLMEAVSTQPHRAGWSLLAFSLTYGILHALGPGHGKVVIATYLATHPSRLKRSLQLTFAASLLQGMVAVILVTIVLSVLQLSSRVLHVSSFWIEKGSYLLVMLLGVWLCVRAVRRLFAARAGSRPPRIQRLAPLTVASSSSVWRVENIRGSVLHDAGCGCGHQHVPQPEALAEDGGWRARLMVVLAMGLRPCSGAILVLLFAKVLGVYGWGILSALTMALGTAFTLSLLAAAVSACRRLMTRLGAERASPRWQQLFWCALSLSGGALLMVVGVVLYVSAQPAMMGGIRPFAG